MGAIIKLETLGGLLIERVDNGWILREATSLMRAGDFGEPRPVRVAETPDALGRLVGEWAAGQHDAMLRRDTMVRDYVAGAAASLS